MSVGLGDPALAVGQRAVDVGATAELDAEEHVDRVVDLVGQVDHLGVEDDHPGAHRPDRGEHRAEDRAVDDRLGHRPGLVDAEDDLALDLGRAAGVADQPLGHDRAVLGQVVLEVGGDRAAPVDVAHPRAAGPGRPVERPGHRLDGALAQPLLELVGHLAHDRPGGLARVLRDHPAEPDERADQTDVGLHGAHHLRLEQHLPQPEPLHRVALHDLHDRGREVGADVAEPARRPAGEEPPRPALRSPS